MLVVSLLVCSRCVVFVCLSVCCVSVFVGLSVCLPVCVWVSLLLASCRLCPSSWSPSLFLPPPPLFFSLLVLVFDVPQRRSCVTSTHFEFCLPSQYQVYSTAVQTDYSYVVFHLAILQYTTVDITSKRLVPHSTTYCSLVFPFVNGQLFGRRDCKGLARPPASSMGRFLLQHAGHARDVCCESPEARRAIPRMQGRRF